MRHIVIIAAIAMMMTACTLEPQYIEVPVEPVADELIAGGGAL